MAGLKKILKLYGRMSVIDKKGNKITYVWDYEKNKAKKLKQWTTKEQKSI